MQPSWKNRLQINNTVYTKRGKSKKKKNLNPLQNVVPNKLTLYGILSQFLIEYSSLGIVKCTCKFTRRTVI